MQIKLLWEQITQFRFVWPSLPAPIGLILQSAAYDLTLAKMRFGPQIFYNGSQYISSTYQFTMPVECPTCHGVPSVPSYVSLSCGHILCQGCMKAMIEFCLPCYMKCRDKRISNENLSPLSFTSAHENYRCNLLSVVQMCVLSSNLFLFLL